ncbi:MAG: electron transporter RnfG [Candidatus Cloacimonadota bacterium]|nr:MAG: electron transporter RnfG [Candidatus Cloacimonadota bacterium]PIE80646.1 MAG: electron transporter RnfG [Candidatus Delongbacteria bacterium]
MGNIFKMSATLFLVAGLASGLLAFYSSMTSPVIKELSLKKETEARTYVVPKSVKEFEEIKKDNITYYKAKDDKGSLIGYVFLAKGPGFSGDVETMVGVDPNFKIFGVKVIKQTETPGLGAETQVVKYGDTKPFFESWFEGVNSINVVVEKDNANSKDKVQSITGATITTRAVCNAINKYSKLVKEDLQEGGM